MNEKMKILFAGESWFFTTIETKGFDQFTIGGYQTEIERVRKMMDEYADITHIPAHLVLEDFPTSAADLKKYDALIISDVGANSFLLHPNTFMRSECTPNRFEAIREYVEGGGAFGMMGGYLTFQGFEGKGKYHGTTIEKILPVELLPYDDREEHPEGFVINVDSGSHPLLKGMPTQWPPLLGYNKLIPKDNADVVVSYNGDPILAIWEFGEGRTFAWASDCAPHWMSPQFCEWKYTKLMWKNVLTWASKK